MSSRKRSPILPLVGTALALLAAIVFAGPGQATRGSAATQPEQRIRFTVDQNSSFVGTLQATDVRLFENDKPQEIVALRKIEDQPLSLAIMIDTSVSQEQTLPAQKFAADSFVQTIMRPGKDQAAVVTFTGSMVVEQGLTNDLALVRQAIARIKFFPPPGYLGRGAVVPSLPPPSNTDPRAGATAIWDAVCETSRQLSAPAATDTLKAIILLTDGEDTASERKMREAIESAVAAKASIYSIGIGNSENYDGVNKGAVRKLSEQTGGRAFFPKNVKDVKAALGVIQKEIRNQYELVYRSTAGGKGPSRKIRVEIINPALRLKDSQISYQRIALAPEP